jgi:hypothetical protein
LKFGSARLSFALIALGAITSARAQDTNSTAAPIVVNTKSFSFAATDAVPEVKQDSFCLPRGEQLIKVTRAYSTSSNAAAAVNVSGDSTTNCINFSVNLPAAQQLCTAIPAPSLSEPGRATQICNTVPTVLNFVVEYQSQTVPVPPSIHQ